MHTSWWQQVFACHAHHLHSPECFTFFGAKKVVVNIKNTAILKRREQNFRFNQTILILTNQAKSVFMRLKT